VIEFTNVSITYPGAPSPVLRDVDLHIGEAELCVVIGRTGSGKSTLLGAVNGLVPHFTGGTLTGRVRVAGRDTAEHPPRELADVVGVVGQDPAAGFVTDVVEDELAYGMESLGLPTAVMRRRVEETLDLLGLAELRARPLATLSGGERQRVAIGAVLAAHPKVLVLDEPTSALDPPAAEDVLAVLQRLVHDLGLTVLMAEHRLERVVHLADRIVHVPGGGRAPKIDTPARVMRHAPVAPPVVELGRLAGWDPLPLSVRDARRCAAGLIDGLPAQPRPAPVPDHDDVVASAEGLVVTYGAIPAIRDVDLVVRRGEIVAVMGRNGAGKSTLLRAMTGLTTPAAGRVLVAGADPARLAPVELIRRVGFVPQDPADLLYAESVGAECAAADDDAGAAAGTCLAIARRLAPDLETATHPRDVSEGQRLALVLAIVLAGTPDVLLLDEPTRGLDYPAKRSLVAVLRDLAGAGHAVVLATHDVELAASVSHRTIVVADGEIVVDGPTSQVVVGSPAFAPQVAKIVAPLPFLTVEQVRTALEGAP
jgi:energy-coupling factor transport system ATP-binding protein